jgi:sugar/nucleoside kinase (ribokinase family)
MGKKNFVTIGHIVNDTEPADHVGGGVSYTALTAHNLGYESHIITKCPQDSPYISYLQSEGISVHLLPTSSQAITSFQNIYEEKSRRKQRVLSRQEDITSEDFSAFPEEILRDAIILVAPVIGEVDKKLFPLLSSYGSLALAPQGYFRQTDNDNNVFQSRWKNFEEAIASVQIVILSEDDITINGKFDATLLSQFRQLVPVTVVTIGDKGSMVYTKDQSISVSAFRLFQNELHDVTGAGDTYAAAFLTSLQSEQDYKTAATTASLYAALKIIGFGKVGVAAIPRSEEWESFIAHNKNRIAEFLKQNNAISLGYDFLNKIFDHY